MEVSGHLHVSAAAAIHVFGLKKSLWQLHYISGITVHMRIANYAETCSTYLQ
jgi:hypothetical protein